MAEEEVKRPRDGKEHISQILQKGKQSIQPKEEPPSEQPTEQPTEQPKEDVETKVETPEQVEETPPVETEVASTEESGKTDTEPANEQGFIDLHDDKVEEPKETPEVLSSLSKELGIEAQSQDDFIEKVSAIKLQNEELRAQLENPEDSNIPDPLKKALELAKSGGDYLDYLGVSSIDYSNIDASELYTNYLASNAPEGTTKEQLREMIDDMPSGQFAINANIYKNQLVQQQQMRKAQLETEAQEKVRQESIKREQNLKQLQQELSNFDNVAGFKVSDSDKKAIYDLVEQDKIADALFYTDGNPDYQKVGKLKFFLDNEKKITDFIKTNARNEAKRDMVDSITNKTIDKNPKVENVKTKSEDPNREKAKNIMESMRKNNPFRNQY